MARVLFVEGPVIEIGGLTTESAVRFDDDMGALLNEVRTFDAQLICVETLVEHIGDREGRSYRRSTNNAADVRQALAPFRALCKKGSVYGLGVIHPRKSYEGGVEDSISGSAAFQQIARSVHHVYRDPADKSDTPARLFFTSKDNYRQRHPPTLGFNIVSWDAERGMACTCDNDDCGHEGRIVWSGEDERTAVDIWQEIVQQRKDQRPRTDTAVQEAEEVLKELADEQGFIDMTPLAIYDYAKENAGISKSAINRARDDAHLGLIPVKEKAFPGKVIGWKFPKPRAVTPHQQELDVGRVSET